MNLGGYPFQDDGVLIVQPTLRIHYFLFALFPIRQLNGPVDTTNFRFSDERLRL